MKLKNALTLAVSMAVAATLANADRIITPTFDASITTSPNAAAIEGSINTAISTIAGLYSNSVNIPVTFTYLPSSTQFLATNTEFRYGENYSTYVSQLQADSVAHPENTVLATAIANLRYGNNANGSSPMVLTAAQLTMLGVPVIGNADVNINSNTVFAFSRPVPSTEFDAIGAIEHELNEVMGGGGAGSTIPFSGTFGATDLYRYSAPFTPSHTPNIGTFAYLSIDGGVTDIVPLSEFPGGFDYGDFATPAKGAGELIQNAVNAVGQYEDYTTSSPEFEMMEAIGWDPAPSVATPEPGTMALFAAGVAALALYCAVRPAL